MTAFSALVPSPISRYSAFMTTLTVTLDDITAQALDRLTPDGSSREAAVVIALHEYLFRQERRRRRERASLDEGIFAMEEDRERDRAEQLVADQDEPLGAVRSTPSQTPLRRGAESQDSTWSFHETRLLRTNDFQR